MLNNIPLLPECIRESSVELSRNMIPVSYTQFWPCFLNICINFLVRSPLHFFFNFYFLANALLFYSSDKAQSVKSFLRYLKDSVDINKKEAVL